MNIHEDPTNSAAQLAQSALQMIQMGRQGMPGATMALPPIIDNTPARQSTSTPFGYLPSYPTPNPKLFQYEPNSGYYYDSSTEFYYDIKTDYYFNPKSNVWSFLV